MVQFHIAKVIFYASGAFYLTFQYFLSLGVSYGVWDNEYVEFNSYFTTWGITIVQAFFISRVFYILIIWNNEETHQKITSEKGFSLRKLLLKYTIVELHNSITAQAVITLFYWIALSGDIGDSFEESL